MAPLNRVSSLFRYTRNKNVACLHRSENDAIFQPQNECSLSFGAYGKENCSDGNTVKVKLSLKQSGIGNSEFRTAPHSNHDQTTNAACHGFASFIQRLLK